MLASNACARPQGRLCGAANAALFIFVLGILIVGSFVVIRMAQQRQQAAPLTEAERKWLVAMAEHTATSDQVVNDALKSLSNYMGNYPPPTPIQLDTRIVALRTWIEQGRRLQAPPRFASIAQEYAVAMDEVTYFFDNIPPSAAKGDAGAMAECIKHMGRGGRCFKDVRAEVLKLLGGSSKQP